MGKSAVSISVKRKWQTAPGHHEMITIMAKWEFKDTTVVRFCLQIIKGCLRNQKTKLATGHRS